MAEDKAKEKEKKEKDKTEPNKKQDDGKEKAEQNKKNSRARKGIGTLWDNIKGARRGNVKDILILKAKLAIYGVLIVLFIFAAIVEAVKDKLGIDTESNISTHYSGSSSSAAESYNKTGSLTQATLEDAEQIKDSFIESISGGNSTVAEILNTKYSGKESSSVANKVTHITTDASSGTTATIDRVENNISRIPGEATPKDERTIYEHILLTEKYNFNNIIWRSFVKSGDSLVPETMQFQLDSESKLKYPVTDGVNSDQYDLNFFTNMVTPYLQSWHIPFAIASGADDAFNADLAYEIITSAYHEIVMDRYRLDTLTRQTNYRVYDITEKSTYVTRTCATYLVRQYRPGAPMGFPSYEAYCEDTESVTTNVQKDIRKNLVRKPVETKSYDWSYVISYAKLFDRVFSTKYELEPYHNYSTENFMKYINKTGEYANMSIDDFILSEQLESQVDSFEHTSKPYYNTTKQTIPEITWNNEFVKPIPAGAIKQAGTEVSQIIKGTIETTFEGKDYIDTYSWSDKMMYSESTNGIYNVDSVRDVTGDDLTAEDTEYYQGLYAGQEINLIDLMNSNKELYSNYIASADKNASSDNIGIRKGYLTLSYGVLKSSLNDVAERFPLRGLMYGSSLGLEGFSLLYGLNLSGIAAAGGVNQAMVQVASKYEGKKLDYMMTEDRIKNTNAFFRAHWCAMFVSYTMRSIEKETGITIPIPSFTGCTTFWRKYHDKPGFFDVIGSSSNIKTDDPAHLAPIEGIQPGDIVLFSWDNTCARHHTAVVKEVERDESGKVTNVITIDGNWHGTGTRSYNNSEVAVVNHRINGRSVYTSLSSISSYISVSTVIAEAQKGNTW